jgi:hypothetical protein
MISNSKSKSNFNFNKSNPIKLKHIEHSNFADEFKKDDYNKTKAKAKALNEILNLDNKIKYTDSYFLSTYKEKDKEGDNDRFFIKKTSENFNIKTNNAISLNNITLTKSSFKNNKNKYNNNSNNRSLNLYSRERNKKKEHGNENEKDNVNENEIENKNDNENLIKKLYKNNNKNKNKKSSKEILKYSTRRLSKPKNSSYFNDNFSINSFNKKSKSNKLKIK